MGREFSRGSQVNRGYIRINTYQLMPPSGCPDIFPVQPCPPCPPCPCTPGVLRTEVYQYTAFSDAVRNVYTNRDADAAFSTSAILSPSDYSLVNLFINGILQPPHLYVVQAGVLILSEAPTQGVPVILQFIKIFTS